MKPQWYSVRLSPNLVVAVEIDSPVAARKIVRGELVLLATRLDLAKLACRLNRLVKVLPTTDGLRDNYSRPTSERLELASA